MQNTEVGSSQYELLGKNVLWLLSGQFISAAISLLALPIITYYLDPKAFGIIALFTVEASFLSGLYGLGLVSFAGRIIYKYDRKNKQIMREYLGITLFYLIVFSLVGLIISIPFVKIIKSLIFKDEFFPSPYLFYIPVIYAFFLSIHGFTTNSFLNLQQNKKLFICNISEIVLLIPAEIVGLVWFGFTWVEVVILQLIVKVIAVLLSLWLIRKELSFSTKKLKIIKYALRYSLPFVPLKFSSWIQQQIDKIFLGQMHAISYVGVYSIGVKFANGFSLVSRPITTSIKPEISKRLDSREVNIQSDIRDFFSLFFQFSLFLIFAISIFSREIVTLFTEAQYLDAFKIIPILMFGFLFSEISGIFHLKFIYKNKTIFFPVVIFLGAILNASLNFFLIPRYNMLGAAFATVLANLTLLFVCYFISQKLHSSRYGIVKNFFALILIASLVLLIQNFLLASTATVFLKCGIILFYGVILYIYLIRTNRRFVGLKAAVIETLRARLWQKQIAR